MNAVSKRKIQACARMLCKGFYFCGNKAKATPSNHKLGMLLNAGNLIWKLSAGSTISLIHIINTLSYSVVHFIYFICEEHHVFQCNMIILPINNMLNTKVIQRLQVNQQTFYLALYQSANAKILLIFIISVILL